MRVINVSENKVNFSQRNNAVNPGKSCNTTSMVMALSYIPSLWKLFKSSENYLKYSKRFSQPEDCLQQYILDRCMKPTLHADLSKGTNDFIGRPVTEFSMNLKLSKLLSELRAGLPVVISGTFPRPGKEPMGHIVCLVGAKWVDGHEACLMPDYWIIDDPYGDTNNGWTGTGNNIEIRHEDFISWIKNTGSQSKWGHTFKVLP